MDAMSDTTPLKVMLVEDHAAFRYALTMLLSADPELEVIAQAGSLLEAKETSMGETSMGETSMGAWTWRCSIWRCQTGTAGR